MPKSQIFFTLSGIGAGLDAEEILLIHDSIRFNA